MFEIPTTNSFSFTITIPGQKQVNYWGKRIKYAYLTNKQQYLLIEHLMTKIFDDDDKVDWVFERHEDGRLHLHGYIMDSFFEYIFDRINTFYKDYRINIGTRKMLLICDIQKTHCNIKYWEDYIEKHQHEIIYKSRFRQQQEDIKALEDGAPIQTQTTPKVFRYDDNGLPIIESYPFGIVKIAPKRKYIVEL